MSTTLERHTLQAEAKQILDLMVHSIYSNRDVFLRELISNSSDALDRRRFEAVARPELLDADTELHIFLEPSKDQRTLTVRDNGIGMGRDEVKDLIGTIARSGTKEFLKQLQDAKNTSAFPELIGQFGVGFYSVFMVADRVTLETRRAGEDKGTRWESSGDGIYTIEEIDRPEIGTAVTLHLLPADEEDNMRDYTDEWVLRDIVKRYSDFVAYPIKMEVERTEYEKDEEGNVKQEGEQKTVRQVETLNSMKAIWLRPQEEVSEEEYQEFYKHIAHDWNPPLRVIRAAMEGTLEYKLLLFIPSKPPVDMFHRESFKGLQLYVKRVFIMDECPELLPEYLRFVRGVVDSEDLSLNVSREILQQNRQIQRIRRGLVKKVLDELKKMREKEPDTYRQFWDEFGRVLKEGIFLDHDHRETLLELSLFHSTHAEDRWTSLEEYRERMKPGQEAIYYITGESQAAVRHSPHLEAFRDKGYEVLLLSDPVDEIWTTYVQEFKGTPLKSAGRGKAELGSEEERKQAEESRKEQEQTYHSLLERLQQDLDERVKEVRLSNRLTSSLACLVSDEGELSPQLEQLMKQMGQEMPASKRILEVNPDHPVLQKLQQRFEADSNDPSLSDLAEVIYDQALLAEGGQLSNPGSFAKRVTDLMEKAL